MKHNLKAELHCHSTLSDGYGSIEQCIHVAQRKKLDVLAITDHDNASGVLEFWNYQPDSLVVIPGEEISTDKGHVIGLFIQRTIQPGPFSQVMEQLYEQNAFPVLAHPYHIPIFNMIRNKSIRSWDENDLLSIKGFEIYNAHNRPQANALAVRWAKKKLKTFTSGSDAHFLFEIGNAITIIESDKKSLSAIQDALENRQTKPMIPTSHNYYIYLIIGMMNKLKKKKYHYSSCLGLSK